MLLNHHIAIALAHERQDQLLSEANAWRRGQAARRSRRGRRPSADVTPLRRPVITPVDRAEARIAA